MKEAVATVAVGGIGEKKLHTFLEGACAIKIGCAVNSRNWGVKHIFFGSIATFFVGRGMRGKSCNNSIWLFFFRWLQFVSFLCVVLFFVPFLPYSFYSPLKVVIMKFSLLNMCELCVRNKWVLFSILFVRFVCSQRAIKAGPCIQMAHCLQLMHTINVCFFLYSIQLKRNFIDVLSPLQFLQHWYHIFAWWLLFMPLKNIFTSLENDMQPWVLVLIIRNGMQRAPGFLCSFVSCISICCVVFLVLYSLLLPRNKRVFFIQISFIVAIFFLHFLHKITH